MGRIDLNRVALEGSIAVVPALTLEEEWQVREEVGVVVVEEVVEEEEEEEEEEEGLLRLSGLEAEQVVLNWCLGQERAVLRPEMVASYLVRGSRTAGRTSSRSCIAGTGTPWDGVSRVLEPRRRLGAPCCPP